MSGTVAESMIGMLLSVPPAISARNGKMGQLASPLWSPRENAQRLRLSVPAI
jgi:hypothetical protein